MDSGSDNESANGDGPKRRRRARSATDRAAAKAARQQRKRDRAEARIREREKSLGGKPEPKRKRRARKLLPQPPGPDDGDQRTKPKLRKLRFAFVILGLTALAFVSWIFGIMMAVAQDLPSLENREQYKLAENSVVYDSYGNKLATLTNNQGRILLSSDEISPVMKEAVVAIEDRRFYEHDGVDFQGIARAVWQDVTSGSAQQGASTITQQFVKNALAAQDSRTVFQKLREAALAYHLERQWSKDKILTEYLNEIYFGEGATGIEAAARTYFGYNHPGCGVGEAADSCASQLLPWEAAMLAGIISSPSAYSPRNFPENAAARRNQVLANMRDEGYITDEEYTAYSARPIPTAKQIQPPAENSAAPYFTSWLRQQLVDRYGAGEAFGGGLQIKSSLDLEFQNRVQEIIQSTLAGIPPTASAVVLDNESGAVLAMVGGSNYQESPFNLATNGHRQPGSSFKPFTLVTALEQGRSTDEVFTSAPQQIPFRIKVAKQNGKGDKVVPDLFRVNNYDDNYLGSASILSGTTYSDNSVYSQLGTQVGVRERRRDREQDGDRDRPRLDQGLRVLGRGRAVAALQPGADPRWARDRGHLARDGPRLQHARRRRQAALRHDGVELRRPGRHPRRHRRRRLREPTGLLPGGRPGARPNGGQRRQQAGRQAGGRPDRRPDRQGRALDRGQLRNRRARPEQRADLGQDGDHR